MALCLEFTSPAVSFWVPGLGASAVRDWTVEGGHMAERCALFIIIALGESILVTGATFAELSWHASAIASFGTAFFGTLAMWWIYFHKGAAAGADNIVHASDPGRLARLGYTYLHMPIVAGIILCAVGDELVLAHPNGHSGIKEVFSLVGGPLLYLAGVIAFKRTIHGWFQLSHLVGIGMLIVLAPLGHLLSPLMLSAASTLILMVVAAWEAISIGAKPTVVNKALSRAQRMDAEH